MSISEASTILTAPANFDSLLITRAVTVILTEIQAGRGLSIPQGVRAAAYRLI